MLAGLSTEEPQPQRGGYVYRGKSQHSWQSAAGCSIFQPFSLVFEVRQPIFRANLARVETNCIAEASPLSTIEVFRRVHRRDIAGCKCTQHSFEEASG